MSVRTKDLTVETEVNMLITQLNHISLSMRETKELLREALDSDRYSRMVKARVALRFQYLPFASDWLVINLDPKTIIKLDGSASIALAYKNPQFTVSFFKDILWNISFPYSAKEELVRNIIAEGMFTYDFAGSVYKYWEQENGNVRYQTEILGEVEAALRTTYNLDSNIPSSWVKRMSQ